jgi:uncharacterized protein YbaR (Trm112 family)
VAACEWLHEVTADGNLVVLVGRADWQHAEDIVRNARGYQLLEPIDERFYELGEGIPRLMQESTKQDRDKLDARLQEVLLDWMKKIGWPDPPFFKVKSVTEWRVVTLPDEEGGPEVEQIE